MARGSLKRCLRFWAAVGSVTAGSCRVRRSAGLRVRCIRDASLRRRGHGDGCLEQPQVAEWPWPLLVQEHSPGVCVLSVRPAYRPLGSGLHGPADDRDPQGTGGHPCSPRPCWHSGSGRVGGTGVRMSTGDVLRWTRAALGSQLSVDLPGQRPLLSGWQCPQLPHGPRWLPELQKAHQTLGWKK